MKIIVSVLKTARVTLEAMSRQNFNMLQDDSVFLDNV